MQQVSCDIYLSSSSEKIHARKNITFFSASTKFVHDIGKKLRDAKQKIPKIKVPSQNFLHKRDKEALNLLLKSIRAEATRKIETCAAEILEKVSDAKDIHLETIPAETRREKRESRGKRWRKKSRKLNKRSLPFLGQIEAYITGQPSPSQWKHLKGVVASIKGALDSRGHEIHDIEHVLEDDQALFNLTFKKLESMTNETGELEDSIASILVFMDFNLKTEEVCSNGRTISNHLAHDSEVLKSIRDNSINFRPDPHLFPKKVVKEKLDEFRRENKRLSPFFSSDFEIQLMYSMRSAVTLIHDNVIHSRLIIPMIDHTLGFKFIEHAFLDKNDLEVIGILEKISLKKLDIVGCNDEQRLIMLFSEADLKSCQSTPQGDDFICKGRMIHLKSGPWPCKNPKLPNSIALELKNDLILLKTDQKSIEIN